MTIVLLLMTIAFAAVLVIATKPLWYRDLLPDQPYHPESNVVMTDDGSDSSGESFSTDWIMPAIAGIVVIGGLSIFVILTKSSR